LAEFWDKEPTQALGGNTPFPERVKRALRAPSQGLMAPGERPAVLAPAPCGERLPSADARGRRRSIELWFVRRRRCEPKRSPSFGSGHREIDEAFNVAAARQTPLNRLDDRRRSGRRAGTSLRAEIGVEDRREK
jgi:hypothetical protein